MSTMSTTKPYQWICLRDLKPTRNTTVTTTHHRQLSSTSTQPPPTSPSHETREAETKAYLAQTDTHLLQKAKADLKALTQTIKAYTSVPLPRFHPPTPSPYPYIRLTRRMTNRYKGVYNLIPTSTFYRELLSTQAKFVKISETIMQHLEDLERLPYPEDEDLKSWRESITSGEFGKEAKEEALEELDRVEMAYRGRLESYVDKLKEEVEAVGRYQEAMELEKTRIEVKDLRFEGRGDAGKKQSTAPQEGWRSATTKVAQKESGQQKQEQESISETQLKKKPSLLELQKRVDSKIGTG
ncbi:Hypothetical predicted protein [Lecanosticta acicola]|uniref:Uncharacterized protein n=1 Tax=Lecanosticta acicola TaxID=111012 RepID=A0AAI8YVL2_9PEZI|nr:Hypothetical predicted protein [Lecanosticta acicola]